VESRILKYAKYRVLGESKNAFHGVLPLCLFSIIFISGCSWFADNRIVIKPESLEPIDNKQRWLLLAPYIKKHFKTDMTVAEIAAELSYQEYLLNKETVVISQKPTF